MGKASRRDVRKAVEALRRDVDSEPIPEPDPAEIRRIAEENRRNQKGKK
ncbi:hypothetical protein [Prauserella muralis]|nr:hypothetical protein [Prauserella muralis]TWE22892.1 hypothetical protein FHX69_4148 [Prauserella muralis]